MSLSVPLLLVAKFRDPWVYSLVKHDGKNFIMIEANIWTLSTTPESQQGSFHGPYFLVMLSEVPMENCERRLLNTSLRKKQYLAIVKVSREKLEMVVTPGHNNEQIIKLLFLRHTLRLEPSSSPFIWLCKGHSHENKWLRTNFFLETRVFTH